LFNLFGYNFTSTSLCLSIILLVPAFWLGIKGVTELGLKVTDTHRPVKVVTSGVYEVVRHPQYLGGLLGHLGVSFLLSSRDAILVTPIVFVGVYFLCWKEERELVKEFGREYRCYQQTIPMLIPNLNKR
jgi:protein-S-isoprenylcysteine O-methyltransferase Ste14